MSANNFFPLKGHISPVLKITLLVRLNKNVAKENKNKKQKKQKQNLK